MIKNITIVVLIILLVISITYNYNPKLDNQPTSNSVVIHESEEDAEYFRIQQIINKIKEYNGVWFTKWAFSDDRGEIFTFIGGFSEAKITHCSPDFKEISVYCAPRHKDTGLEVTKLIDQVYPDSTINLYFTEEKSNDNSGGY
jgi:hypothetical protein